MIKLKIIAQLFSFSDMAKNVNPKIDLLIHKGIFDILLLIYRENGMVEVCFRIKNFIVEYKFIVQIYYS